MEGIPALNLWDTIIDKVQLQAEGDFRPEPCGDIACVPPHGAMNLLAPDGIPNIFSRNNLAKMFLRKLIFLCFFFKNVFLGGRICCTLFSKKMFS